MPHNYMFVFEGPAGYAFTTKGSVLDSQDSKVDARGVTGSAELAPGQSVLTVNIGLIRILQATSSDSLANTGVSGIVTGTGEGCSYFPLVWVQAGVGGIRFNRRRGARECW